MTLRALVVGINQYPAPNPLRGCVADALAWRDALEQQGCASVALLTDAQATRANILTALAGLLRESAPGDTAVFCYSGHGTQVPDRNGDEGDGYDEALVPVDYRAGRFLTDDDLHDALAAAPAGVHLVCFFDSCYAGTCTRLFSPPGAAADRQVRYLSPSAAVLARHRAFRAAQPTPAPVTAEQLRWVEFAACSATETSAESAGPDGQVRGAFSRVAAPLVAAATPRTTRRGLLTAVRRGMGSAGQHPGLDGPAAAQRRTLWGSTAP